MGILTSVSALAKSIEILTYVSHKMLSRLVGSRRLIAVVSLDCFSRVTLKSEKFPKLGVTLSTSRNARDTKPTYALCLSVLGFLGVSSALFYWNKKKKGYSSVLPIVQAKSEGDDIPRSKRFNFLAEAVEKAIPAVVHIENQQEVQTFYDRKPKRMPVSNGSGFIVDDRGFILTNAHVIANASYISVRLHSGETFPATVVDVDQVADLALIKLEASYKQKFPALKFGKSTQLRPGEWVIALGSPLALKNTITSGIVSTVGRTSKELGLNRGADMEYIQTDAPITVGNSGGPLVNLDGEVVGINTMTASPGISFAVPSQVAEDFISTAHKASPKEKPRKYGIGVSMMSLSPRIMDSIRYRVRDIPAHVQNGVFLARVWPNSPANKAGLQANDIIVKINKTHITSSSQIYDMVQKGKSLTIEVIRGHQKLNIVVTPEPII